MMNAKIHYVNDGLHKGYYFYWFNQMKLYATRAEAEAALAKYQHQANS